jgi:galactokinase
VSCEELDILVDASTSVSGVYGSRMMGGGFGGCTINLVSKVSADIFIEKVGESFKNKFGSLPTFYQVEIAQGAHIVD